MLGDKIVLLHRKFFVVVFTLLMTTACGLFPAHSKLKLNREHSRYSLERAELRLLSIVTLLAIMHYSALPDTFTPAKKNQNKLAFLFFKH